MNAHQENIKYVCVKACIPQFLCHEKQFSVINTMQAWEALQTARYLWFEKCLEDPFAYTIQHHLQSTTHNLRNVLRNLASGETKRGREGIKAFSMDQQGDFLAVGNLSFMFSEWIHLKMKTDVSRGGKRSSQPSRMCLKLREMSIVGRLPANFPVMYMVKISVEHESCQQNESGAHLFCSHKRVLVRANLVTEHIAFATVGLQEEVNSNVCHNCSFICCRLENQSRALNPRVSSVSRTRKMK